MHRIGKKSVNLKIVCDADELARLFHIQGMINKKDDDHEQRISVIEEKIKNLEQKSQQPVIPQPSTNLSDFPQLPQRNRGHSSSNIRQVSQPSGRSVSQYSDLAARNMHPSTPIGAELPRTNDHNDDNWTVVNNRNKNSHRPAYWGRKSENSTSSTLRGVEKLGSFLIQLHPNGH